MHEDAYYAGVSQALFDAGVTAPTGEKQASYFAKQAGKVSPKELGLLARLLESGGNALTRAGEFAVEHPVVTGSGAGAGLGALTGGVAGGDLESALIGAGAGAGLGALGGLSPAALERLKALRKAAS